MRRNRLLVMMVVAGLTGVLGVSVLRAKYPPVDGGMQQVLPHPVFAELDPWLQDALLDEQRDINDRYADLFRYFVAGYLAYRSEDGARAFYPGAASNNGRALDGLEGFSRTAPLIAAWLYGGRAETVTVPRFGPVDLVSLLRKGIVNGTDPLQNAYWGRIGTDDQRIVEAADIALALWLTRDTLWDTLDSEARHRVTAWLAQAEGKVTKPGNWRLFPVLINRVLESLGVPVNRESFARDWSTLRASYAGSGWFHDQRQARIDFYNAWAFHYALYWLTLIDPGFETEFITDARREFVAFFRYFIAPKGLPIFGRSICYRTAAPTPLVIAAHSDGGTVEPGEARRALDRVWRYFVNRGGVANGGLSQGYCGRDLRILDRYSGPASCLWGTRSLVAAFTHPAQSPFWSAPERPLPVEQADFEVHSPAARLTVRGDRSSGAVVVRRDDPSPGSVELEAYTWRHRLAERLLQRPFRPTNKRAKYARAAYRSDQPFCGCGTAS